MLVLENLIIFRFLKEWVIIAITLEEFVLLQDLDLV